MLMQGQRQRESVRQGESEEGMGEQERGKKELDCIIDYPITATGLWNYPSPRQPVTHPERSRATDSCPDAHRQRMESGP